MNEKYVLIFLMIKISARLRHFTGIKIIWTAWLHTYHTTTYLMMINDSTLYIYMYYRFEWMAMIHWSKLSTTPGRMELNGSTGRKESWTKALIHMCTACSFVCLIACLHIINNINRYIIHHSFSFFHNHDNVFIVNLMMQRYPLRAVLCARTPHNPCLEVFCKRLVDA